MAFTGLVTNNIPGGFGSKRFTYGTYANTGGSTGGDITTNLSQVDGCWLSVNSSSVGTNESAVNETFPLVNTGGVVTIVTDANQSGYWYAFGY